MTYELPDHIVTVRQLIDELSELPLDLPVLVPRDEEGNGYHWCRGVYTSDDPVDYSYVTADELQSYHVDEVVDEMRLAEDCEPGADLAALLESGFIRVAVIAL